MANISNIHDLAKKLNLWNIARGYVDLDNKKLSNLDYLEYVLSEELRVREQQRAVKIAKASKLPQVVFDESKLTEGIKWHYYYS